MSTTLNVLLVEDSDNDAELLIHHLQRGGYAVNHRRVETAAAMKDALGSQEWDIIISDYSLPQFSAPKALATLKAQTLDIPFIIMSGTIGEEAAVSALLAGANDFVLKDHPARLIPIIERELREAQERRNRREAEEELRRAEERFTKAFRLSPTATSISTLEEGRFIDVNDSFLTMLDYSREEVIRHTVFELDIWVDLNDRVQIMQELQEQGPIYEWETRLRTKLGEIRHALISLEAIDLDDGACVLAIIHDVTERKRAEETLQNYNRRLQTLHAIDQAILSADSEGAVAHLALRYFLEKMPIQAASMVAFDFDIGKGLILTELREDHALAPTQRILELDEWLPGDIEMLQMGATQIVEVSATSQNLPPGLQALCGNGLSVFLRMPLIAQGELIGTLNLGAENATVFTPAYTEVAKEVAAQVAIAIQQSHLRSKIHRHAAQLEKRVTDRTAELQKTTERVEAILNNSSDAIVFLTFDGVIQQVNPSFGDLLGYMNDDILGHSILELASEKDMETLLNALSVTVNTSQSSRLDFVAARKDGTVFDADMALAAIRASEKLSGLVCSLRDNTERKRAEGELRRALEKEKELRELKSNFTSMVSHEFRTPLTVIRSSSEMLQRYSSRMDEDKKQVHFEQIQSQVEQLVGLMNDVLILGRADAIDTKVTGTLVNLTSFCSSIVTEIHLTSSAHHIEFVAEGEPTAISIDEKLMRQAVANLLSNAVKYSPQGGTVKLTLSYEPQQIVIQVHDNGIGIPLADQQRLFEVFHRASNVGSISGTGLGLPIVKRAVEAHGGTIHFESEVGLGTTFTLMIPRRF